MPWNYTLSQLAQAVGAGIPASFAGLEATSVSTDTRTLQPGAVFFALPGERFDGHAFVAQAFNKGAAVAVTNRPCPEGPCLLVSDPLAALQAFSAWHRARHTMPLIAITGSCGKTSTKEFTAALLATRYQVARTRGNLNNEIGCPLSLLEIDTQTGMAVIEMGANHIGEIAALCRLAHPTESAITLVAPSHLEGFGSVEGVARAKREIVEGLEPGGVFYANVGDPWCMEAARYHDGTTIRFGRPDDLPDPTDQDVVVEDCSFGLDGEMRIRLAPIGEIRLPLSCRAHAMNVALAAAIGMRHGVTAFEDPLRQACALSTRFRVLEANARRLIDDTYNANPASMAAALRALAEQPGIRRIAILGDMLELGDKAPSLHAGVGRMAAELRLDAVYARGAFASFTIQAAQEGGIQDARVIQDYDGLAQAALASGPAGSVILVKGSRGMRMEEVLKRLLIEKEQS